MIEVKNLTKYFIINNRKTILFNDVNFYLPDKGIYFIEGKSGSGKSTLLYLLSGIERGNSGSIKINSKRIDKMNEIEKEEFFKNEIGFLFQSFNLINELSVKDNLSLTNTIKETKFDPSINHLLSKFGLIDKLDQKVFTLSGGEKQRLSLIRCLLNKPKIIFADEPTGALDNENSLILMEELKNISKNSLVIIVSHDKELTEKYADGIIHIFNKEVNLINVYRDNENEYVLNEKKIVKRKTKFLNEILKRNLKKNFLRNFFIFIALIFSLTTSLLSFSFYLSIKDYSSSLIYMFPNSNIYEIYKTYNKSISKSSLSIEKKERLDEDNIFNFLINLNINEYELMNNYSYFFNDNIVRINEKEFKNLSFLPLINEYNNEVFVNKAFVDTYLNGKLEGETTLNIKSKNKYTKFSSITNDEIEETFVIDLNFKIINVKDEFSYLSTPKIYYSYYYFSKCLASLVAHNVSLMEKQTVSYLDLLLSSSKSDSLSGYSSYIYLYNKEDILKINDYIAKKDYIDSIKLSSNNYLVVSSFLEIINSLFIILIFFIILLSLTSFFIIFSLIFYNYLSTKKERAILIILGSNKSSYTLTNQIEIVLNFIISFIFSHFLYLLIKEKISAYLIGIISFNIEISLNLMIEFLIFLLFLSFIILSSLLPLKYEKKISLSRELKEE